MKTHKISWLNIPGYIPETWNPIIGCSKISEGCQNCYAERMAGRLSNIFKPSENYLGVVKHRNIKGSNVSHQGYGAWNGNTVFVESALEKPFKWTKPRAIFVCSMSDLFHENTPHSWIHEVFEVIQNNPRHLFILLTKRPENALKFFDHLSNVMQHGVCRINFIPLNNIWLGVTCENQEQADKRIFCCNPNT